MPTIQGYLAGIDFQQKDSIGTIALRNEELALPDGSKAALGMDDGHWVLIHQQSPGAPFVVFEYNLHDKKITVDKKPGAKEDIKQFKRLVGYFFSHARIEELVTILPPEN